MSMMASYDARPGGRLILGATEEAGCVLIALSPKELKTERLEQVTCKIWAGLGMTVIPSSAFL